MGVKYFAGCGHSSLLSLAQACSALSFYHKLHGRGRRTPRCFVDTRFPLPCSGKLRGTTTAFSRWNRLSFLYDLHSSTTISSGLSSAHRIPPSPTMTLAFV